MDKIVLKCNKCNRFYVCGEMKDIGSTDNLRDCGGANVRHRYYF